MTVNLKNISDDNFVFGIDLSIMFINRDTVICLKNGTYSVIIYVLSGILIQSNRLSYFH